MYQDLKSDDVMILDSGDEIYVWVGTKATSAEKEKAQELAKVQYFPKILFKILHFFSLNRNILRPIQLRGMRVIP